MLNRIYAESVLTVIQRSQSEMPWTRSITNNVKQIYFHLENEMSLDLAALFSISLLG